MFNGFYPVFEFIIWPFKTPDKGETNEFDHLRFWEIYHSLRLLLVKRSKSHQRYLNALKSWDLNFLFFLMQLGDLCTKLENSITSLLQIFTLH